MEDIVSHVFTCLWDIFKSCGIFCWFLGYWSSFIAYVEEMLSFSLRGRMCAAVGAGRGDSATMRVMLLLLLYRFGCWCVSLAEGGFTEEFF